MRESRTLGSVRAKAEWLSYSTIPPHLPHPINAILNLSFIRDYSC